MAKEITRGCIVNRSAVIHSGGISFTQIAQITQNSCPPFISQIFLTTLRH